MKQKILTAIIDLDYKKAMQLIEQEYETCPCACLESAYTALIDGLQFGDMMSAGVIAIKAVRE